MERIVTAVYSNRREAEAAKNALKSANIHENNVHIIDRDTEVKEGRYDETNKRYRHLSDSSIPDDELHTYHDALDRGETLVQARVDDNEVSEAVRVLEGGGIDLDEREKGYTNEHRFGTRNAYGRGDTTAHKEGDTIPVVEERMNVGKREVDKGSVKVRSYVTEKPVEKDVTLRSEEVDVERHKVGKTLSPGEADSLLKDKTVEVHERGEEAVVNKEAVLKEEVEVGKTATEKKKHVVDQIRSTEVDVDDDTKDAGVRTERRDDRHPNR